MTSSDINLSNSSDLIRWAGQRDSQSGLPRLVRRLIISSVAELRQVSFPADEGVALHGWDGTTIAESVHPFVPEGSAGWEVSVRQDVKTKANEDWASRRENPGTIDPRRSAFVFVTLRRWPGKARWIAAKAAEQRWRSVHVYDADDLETWLEATPAVHVWISVFLGKRLENAVDLETWWEDWSHVTKPRLTPKVLLAGRSATTEAIHERLLTTHSFAVRADSAEEALAIFAAAINELAEVERETFLARTIIVRDRVALDHFAAAAGPLILIPTFDDPSAIARATRRGHLVVATVPRTSPDTDTTVTVSRLSVAVAADALIGDGIHQALARDLAILARRSLMAFRRKLAVRPEVQTPLWARPEQASSVLPFFLAGAWDESSEGDQRVVAGLATGEPHRVQEAAIRWAREVDPPIRSVGRIWYVASKEDSWVLLAPSLGRADMERLQRASLTVLGGRDPRFDLPADTRWMSNLRSPYSGVLRDGLAETLAIMGARGSGFTVAGITVAQWAQVIVRELLQQANTDWRLWATLSHHLPLIAEAAPSEFLAGVERGLVGDQPLTRLFHSQGHSLFSSTPHVGLLWALEGLAWSPEHLARTALVLAKLARLELSGRTSNTPRASLQETFRLWHPHTAASWPQQLRVLRTLLDREPAVGWRIHVDVLPRLYESSFGSSQLKWRDWADEVASPTVDEVSTHIDDVVTQMLTVVDHDGQRWANLIASSVSLPLQTHDKVVTQLGLIESSSFSDEDRALIWSALRKRVADHRSFPDADWALPQSRVDKLGELYSRLTPDDPLGKFGWLFATHVTLPAGSHTDWDEEEDAVAEAQRDAVESIYTESGLQGIEDLIESVGDALPLGLALGLSELVYDDDRLLKRYLADDRSGGRRFAKGLIFGHVTRNGQQWALAKFSLGGLSDPQRAAILSCLPHEMAVWTLASVSGPIDEAYWKQARTYFKGSPEHVEYAAQKLMGVGRAFAALELLASHVKDSYPPNTVIVAEVLEAAVAQSEVDGRDDGLSHRIGALLDYLASAPGFDEGRVARIEWAFAPLISRDRHLKVLCRELSRNPQFFAELILCVYPAQDDERRELSEEEERRGETAYRVLEAWKSLPGTCPACGVDTAVLHDWVIRALALVTDQKRPIEGAQQIGYILSHGPHGADGAWPHEAVRDLIEELENPDLESGFKRGRYNSRGVVTRSPTDGGRQERGLADQYATWAAQIRDRWPRTGAILATLEANYRAHARAEDDATDLRLDGMW